MNNNDTLAQLHQTLVLRLEADADSSYVASLYHKGLDAILKKIGEEATETVMAAKDGDAQKIVYEVADLWFHTMVLLAHQGLEPQQIIDELARRMGVSGIDEKASRTSWSNIEDKTMGLGGISIWQLLIVLVIVALIFGTKKLRGIGGDLGGAVKGFKKAIDDDKKDNDEAIDEAEKATSGAEKATGEAKSDAAKK